MDEAVNIQPLSYFCLTLRIAKMRACFGYIRSARKRQSRKAESIRVGAVPRKGVRR